MLKELLISEVRVNLIKFLIKNFENEFHVRALVRELGVEINAVRRELEKLTNLNILTKNPWGNKIFYKINSLNPYFYDLVNFVYREEGLSNKIIKNIENLGDLKFVALSKEFCMGRKTSGLDLDLLVVGAPHQTALDNLIANYEKEDREVNYSVLSEEEFLSRKRKADSFVLRFIIQPKIMIAGDELEFSKIN
jgi:hypothetical protein